MDAIIMTDTGAHNRKRSASTISNGQLPTPSISPLGSPLFRGLEPNGEVHSLVGKAILVNGPGTTYSPNAVPPEEDMLPLDRPAETVLPQATRRPSQDAVSKRRTSTSRATSPTAGGEILKLSPAKIQELTASPESLPVRAATPLAEHPSQRLPSLLRSEEVDNADENKANVIAVDNLGKNGVGRLASGHVHSHGVESSPLPPGNIDEQKAPQTAMGTMSTETNVGRPFGLSRTLSTPPNVRRKSWSKTHSALQQSLNHNKGEKSIPPPLNLREIKNTSTNGNAIHPKVQSAVPTMASPMPTSIPLPPMSIPTYLQLELSSERPSPLYIHRSSAAEFPYETSAVKFERLLNFLLLPPELEYVLGFGAFACLDAFLYVFTILPLRFFKAITILTEWALENVAREGRDIGGFIYRGIPRLWTRQRGRQRASSIPKKELEKLQLQRATTSQSTEMGSESSGKSIANGSAAFDQVRKRSRTSSTKHRRMRSTPSTLASTHKADLLKGLLVVVSCAILLRFDASRMYHSIRGQAAIKLYVIYNVLEVADRLLSAIGQDVLECLFSDEVLDRDADGRSKIIRPLWMFLLALFYNVVHATALFYQCITLNVAVNSYSNALLTLLMSNQFVEIKGTVFKKFEKENLFQITCADIVERFQLWLMLTVIALRNLVEMGSLSISLSTVLGTASTSSPGSNATAAPLTSANILPKAFTVLPNWAGEVLGPFLIVLGSEMLVDWLKHAYIGKFNNTKPDIYGRFLDVIAKDYYSHAFAEQNLTKRLGLPILPLACLFIRAVSQTYHMFLATHVPLPIPSTATSVSVESATSPATTAAFARIDEIFRRALGRSSFGAGATGVPEADAGFRWWDVDDLIAIATMVAFFGVCYLFLLAAKLVLGMFLLSFARQRYKMMKEREKGNVETEGRRVGGWGVVEVDEEKRRWIYQDDDKGLEKIRMRDDKAKKEAREGKMPDLTHVDRYAMVAKRIW